MGSPKRLVQWGGLAKVEAASGTPEVLAAATDGVDLIERPSSLVDYMHQGQRRGKSPASHGGRRRVGRMGRFGTGTVMIEPAGPTAAFAAGVASNMRTWMRAAGFDVAIDTTPGSEKETYTPHPVGAEQSITFEAYERGQKYPLAGVYSNLKLSSDVPGIPVAEFAYQGLFSALPTDAVVPAITYPWGEPAKCEGINLQATIGGTTFIVGKLKSWALEIERNIAARAHDNTAALHGGFNVGAERLITLEALIEAVPLTAAPPYLAAAGFNIFELMERASVMALAFGWGSAQYNTHDITAATAQLVEAPEQEEGPASMWNCKWELKPSSLTANDELSYVIS